MQVMKEVALAEALKVNKTLTHLYIKQNDIGNAGAKALLDVLKENDTLKKIDISLNDIDEEHSFLLKSLPRVKSGKLKI